MVCKYLDFEKVSKKFYLYDTFSGLAPETSSPEEMVASAGYKTFDIEALYAQVQALFSAYPNVLIVKGVVPVSFKEAVPDKIAYLHIDMNCVLPEKAALEFFWPKIVKSGIIILDDYGFQGHEAQAAAADNFAKSNGVKILCLPTGQGLIFKP